MRRCSPAATRAAFSFQLGPTNYIGLFAESVRLAGRPFARSRTRTHTYTHRFRRCSQSMVLFAAFKAGRLINLSEAFPLPFNESRATPRQRVSGRRQKNWRSVTRHSSSPRPLQRWRCRRGPQASGPGSGGLPASDRRRRRRRTQVAVERAILQSVRFAAGLR